MAATLAWALPASAVPDATAADLRAWLASSAGAANYTAAGPELAETVERSFRLLAPPVSDVALDSALALVTAEMAGFAEAYPEVAYRELVELAGVLYGRRLRDYEAAVPLLREAMAGLPDGDRSPHYFYVADALTDAHFWRHDAAAVLALAEPAYRHAIAIGDERTQLTFATWLGKGFAMEYVYPKAEEYYREAIRLAGALRDDGRRAEAYLSLGAHLQRSEEPARAVPVLDSALAYAVPGSEREALARLWLGVTRSSLGDAAGAIEALERARRLLRRTDNETEYVHALMELARAYRRGGAPARTIALVDTAMAATAGWTNIYHRLFRHDELSYAYADAERYDSAYHHLKVHVRLRDRLDSVNHHREIRLLGDEYAEAREEALVAAQAGWVRERRGYQWGLGLTVLLLVVAGVVAFARR